MGAEAATTHGSPEPGGNCPSCGAALIGRFCHGCGEVRPDPRRDRILAYLVGPFRALGSLEGRWPRALWSLVRRPGELAVEWARGARVRWPRPWSVFLFVNVVYYFVAGLLHIGLLRTPLAMHLSGSPWRRDVVERISTRGFSRDDILALRSTSTEPPSAALLAFTRDFDAHAASVSKLVVVSLVPMFAVLLGLAHARQSRRPIHHLVHATHFVSWWIGFAVLLLLPVTEALARLLWERMPGATWLRGDAVTVPTLLLGTTLWLASAERRFYGEGRRRVRWARSVALAFGLLVLVVLPLRRLEFLVAWWTF